MAIILIFNKLIDNNVVSSIIMFIGFIYLLYNHYKYQCYYNNKLNCFYSSLWFSMALSTFVYIFLAIFAIKIIYQIFLGISAIGLIIGWFINILYYNQYISIISNKIEKKYNQQHVISALKEEIEMNRYQDDETKSLETIGILFYLYYQI